MDLLDFEADTLYFDKPVSDEVQECLDQSSRDYGKPTAEQALLRAYFLEPEHLMVLVALYRYYYYQHRLQDTQRVADRVLALVAEQLKLPTDWRALSMQDIESGKADNFPLLRFYLLALKGSGFIDMRIQQMDRATAKLEKVVELDPQDRLGASALLAVLEESGHLSAETASTAT